MAQDTNSQPPAPSLRYLKVTLELPEGTPEDVQDEVCFELMTHGASGTVVETDRVVQFFVAEDVVSGPDSCQASARVSAVDDPDIVPLDSTLGRLRSYAEERGFTVVSVEQVPMDGCTTQSWTAQCPELWAPISAGVLQIEPVESAEGGPADAKTTIRIIPGLGFGTGHHQTTRMIVSTLGSLWAGQSVHPCRALDVGTGSGLLAIVIARLFGVPVEGIDNDATALINARDNVTLNGLSTLVHLSTVPLHELTGPYDLIVANIYGEVLCAMADDLTRLAAPDCVLLLSGITELVRQQVIDTFTLPTTGATTPRWQLTQTDSVDGWSCLHLKHLPAAR